MRKLGAVFFVIIAVFMTQVFFDAEAHAANPADFNPGRIIDDELFYNKDGMGNVANIQAFLDAHVPTCDTWGTKPSGYGNLTNAQYAQQVKGWPGPPYVCLNNYYENPNTGATSYENGGGAFSGGLSAAQIIYNASQQYNINPKVLLVMLRKESDNLFGDSWPLKVQYKYAMGYACPDSGPGYSAACVDSKSGFYKQMTLAAWQLRYYYDHMGEYNYAPGRWNTIQYSTRPECGTKDVFIQNYATASLYIYTPYVPNDAALNAYPGVADCGAYGNRNFWFMWQEWFGSTYAGVHISSSLRVTGGYGSSVFSDTPTTVSFDITNDSNNSIDVGGMAVAVRDSSGGNHDYSLKSMIIPARSTITYTDTQTLNSEDTYTFSLANYSGGAWRSDYPTMLNAIEPRSKSVIMWKVPTLTQGITITNGPLQTGKTHTIVYTVKNNSASTRAIGSLGLMIRGPSGQNLDPAPVSPVSLGAGQSQTLSFTFKPQTEGAYRFGVAALLNDWVSDYPAVRDSGLQGTLGVTSLPKVVLSASPSTLATDPRTNQNVPLSFKVRNNSEDTVDLGKLGLWGRDPQNRNIDPGIVSTVLNPGEERTLSFGFRTLGVGTYTFGVLGTVNGSSWNAGPALAAPSISRNLSVSVKDGVVISNAILLNGATTGAYIGQSSSVAFKVKNYGDISVDLGKLGLWGRDPQNRNIDPGIVSTVLNPGEERTLSFPVRFNTTGAYRFGVLQTTDNGVTWRDGPVADVGVQKQLTAASTSGTIISQGPVSSVDSQHVHATETTNIAFKIKNQTGVSLDLGKLGLWGRDPQNRNIDPGIVSTVLNPGEERTLSFPVLLNGGVGAYTFGILATTDNGVTWTSGPDLLAGQANKISLEAKQSATLTASLSTELSQPTIGQCDTLTYKVRNYDLGRTVDLGKLGLWGRDPQNRNIDPGIVSTVLNPGEERTLSFPVCYSAAGSYSFGILQTINNGSIWTSGPQKESDSLLNSTQVSVR